MGVVDLQCSTLVLASDGYKEARRMNTYFNTQGSLSFHCSKIVTPYMTASAMDDAGMNCFHLS